MKLNILILLLCLFCLGCASRHFFEPSPLVERDKETHTQPYPDSVLVQAGKHYKSGKLYSFFIGKHYRETWSTPVRVRVLNLNKERGGLKIEKVGGSMQSTSFTLVDQNGLKYALRTVDKDPSKGLPSFFQKTFVADFMRDQTAALNPYAALIVAPLAQAAGIPHASPELVYLPSDSSVLGEYTEIAGDRLYMLEEKLEDKRVLLKDTASLTAFVSTEELLENRFKSNLHQVDQLAFAKARLLDILINDRDRHEGQWNWSVHQKNGLFIYRPIPKDRDQAFYRFAGGILPTVVGRGLNYQKFISFQSDFRDLKALTHKSKYIDSHFLSEVTQEQFDSLAKDMQLALTNEVIEKAVQSMPYPVYEKIGERTATVLKSRRDKLQHAAREFHKLLAKEVTIAGSDDKETIEVKRLPDGNTEVRMLRISDGALLYNRTFKTDETKSISIYGLGGDDRFEITGNVENAIVTSIYGGPGDDTITDSSQVSGWGKKTYVYDTAKGSKLRLGSETRFKTMPESKTDIFDRKGT